MIIITPRFTGNPLAEACLQGTDRLTHGRTDPLVTLVQQTLMELGYPLPLFGADSIYGDETYNAVFQFKKDRGIKNSANQIDGIVGPKTMAALVVEDANRCRNLAIQEAVHEIDRLQTQFQTGVPDESDHAVRAFERQMLTSPNSEFWNTVAQARAKIVVSQGIAAPFIVDRTQTGDFAHVDATGNPTLGITFLDPFFTAGFNCQQEVITHEFFHFVVGLQHHYDAQTTDDALNCPHHLAELVFDLATGQTGGCGQQPVCF